jgi:hypothetical protein
MLLLLPALCFDDNDSVPAEEFRQHYQSLSDEGLLEIDPDDLTDAARVCFEEEVASRGLQLESVAPPAEPTPEEMIEWAPLDVFNDDEMKVVQSLLEAEGVPNSMKPRASENYPPSAAGSVLFVPASSLEKARQILAPEISDEELAAEAETYEKPEDA